jgi:hypothetical protein
MLPSFRQRFNANYSGEKYRELLRTLEQRCGTAVKFRVSETPCFFPKYLLDEMADAGIELTQQLVENSEYRAKSDAAIPPVFKVPSEDAHPMFVQVDFGLVRNADGTLKPKLVELQAFPSLYCYQMVLAQSYVDVYGIDQGLQFLLGGLNENSYVDLLKSAIVAEHDPENVILMEIDPLDQKTLPDFLLTEKLLGIRTVCITQVKKEGRKLFYDCGGKRMPIKRIYNRAIVDELERKNVKLGFDLRDELDVEWAGHPNWYFRISKFSIPYLRHETVPKTWFLDELPEIPAKLQSYALKPLYSFAGLGVVIPPTKADIQAVPPEKRAQFILQERLDFEPVIDTPSGKTKAEIRIMYIWLETMLPVLTIIRMGRGLMMGVDHNRNMEWVGSSAGLWADD